MKQTLLLTIVLLLSSCDPAQYGYVWQIVNNTGQTVQLKQPDLDPNQPENIVTIPPNETQVIYITTGGKIRNQQTIYFNRCFEYYISVYGEEVYWQVLSEDGVILKTWKYLDRWLPDQRFFDETSWRKEFRSESGPGFISGGYYWTFEILTEDIAQN